MSNTHEHTVVNPYTRRWLQVMVPTMMILFAAALLMTQSVGFVIWVLALATSGALISILTWSGHPPASIVVRKAAAWGALSGLGAGAAAAVVVVSGATLLAPCLLVAGLTCPPVLARLRGWSRRPSLGRSPLAKMSDAQLCCAWRTSSMALLVLTTQHEQLAISEQRGRYLDEMEHRNAAGLKAWLEDGKGVDEALEGFLVGDGHVGT